jgi:hypothetical protein
MTTNLHEVRARDQDRERLARDLAEFEKRNGTIEKLPPTCAALPDDDDE